MAYSLDVLSIEKESIIESLSLFLLSRGIHLAEINATRYQTNYSDTQVLSIRLIVLIPAHIQLINLREDLFDYCDELNIDALFEPIKR
jgi:glycine cleavage system transcriptional repressor